MIKQTVATHLEQLKGVLFQVSDAQFAEKLPVLSYSTIGMHVRHIIEFYQCLLAASAAGLVDYDARKRNAELETNTAKCMVAIDDIVSSVVNNTADFPLQLRVNYSLTEDISMQLETTFLRELLYNIEHTVHHLAIIKIGVMQLHSGITMDEHFGVAVSTIRNKNLCAQ
jgi:hypothetical protein